MEYLTADELEEKWDPILITEINWAITGALGEMADEDAARAYSMVGDADLMELPIESEDDVFMVAEIGDAVAVNGDLVEDDVDIPPGFVFEKYGSGRVYGEETGHQWDHVVDRVAMNIHPFQGKKVPRQAIKDVFAHRFDGAKMVYWNSGGGDVSMYVRPLGT